MGRSVAFYSALGFEIRYGGPDAAFTSFTVGGAYLNLQLVDTNPGTGWGRSIWYVDDVDAMHRRALDAGITPDFPPRDAEWGERYTHVTDPDGHELSLARPL
ncbi:VOC family protein [Euzebya sp.]|uniref:VOC family protein n=1 Tax=Euzebya sp. TaxID=1971409 RepID=UPI0035178F7F